MDLFEIAPELDRWLDDNCIIAKADRIEATLDGEAMHFSVVEQKLKELAVKQNAADQLINDLRKLLSSTDSECAAKEALIQIKQYKKEHSI